MYLETLQECRSRRQIGWIIQDFQKTCVFFNVAPGNKDAVELNPLTKEESCRVYNCDDERLSGSTKCWIFKSMWNISSLRHRIFKIHPESFTHRSVIVVTFPRPETWRWTKRTVIGCLTCRSNGLMGGPWPMKAAIYSRPSAVSLKVWLRETSSMNVIWTYYIRHVVIITWPTSISSVASLPFSNLQNLAGSSRSSGYFCLLFYEYCEFRHTYFVTYCFCLLCSREVCDFGCSPIVFLLSAALILQSHYNLRHTHILWILKQTGYDIALGI